MSVAAIKVDGVAGRPAVTKVVGATVTLTNTNNAGVASWLWTVVFAPAGTTAALAPSAVVAAPTLGPLDRVGTYWVRLAVNGATGDFHTDAEVDEIVIRVRPATGIPGSPPAVGETDQGGAQGWADETTGMNALLLLLLGGATLQGAYDLSAPPLISVSAALGPLQLKRDAGVAGAGQILLLEDAASPRAAFYDDGRVAITAKHFGAGSYTLDLDIPGAGLQGMYRFQNSVVGTFLQLYGTGKLYGLAKSADYGLRYDAQGCAMMLSIEDSTAADPVIFSVAGDGQISAFSSGAINGLEMDAKGCTATLVSLVNSANAGQAFLVRPDGSLYCKTKLAAANDGLEVDAPTCGGANLLKMWDSTSGDFFRVTATGRLESRMHVAGGDDGVNLYFATLNAAANSALVLQNAVGIGFAITPSCLVYQKVDHFNAAGAGTCNSYWQDWSGASPVINGQTRRGFFADGSALAVNGGGTWTGFLASLLGVVAGTAACFRAEVTTQAVPAYKVGIGAGGATPFVGYDHFVACDFRSAEAAGVANWDLVLSAITGATTYLVAVALASAEAEASLSLPPLATVTEVSVRVYQAVLHKQVQVQLIAQDDSDGAGAQTQTVIATGTSVDAVGDCDVVLAPVATTTPAATSATQVSYRVQVISGSPLDRVYCGHAKYTYGDLQHGA
jgi:hypothetical protein